MTKSEFLSALRGRLTSLSDDEIQKTTLYYSEMIEDRVEDGMTVDEAIEALGPMDDIVREALGAHAEAKPAAEKKLSIIGKWKKKRAEKGKNRALAIVIAIVTAPIWIPILIALLACAAAVTVAILACVWSIVAAAFSVLITSFATGLACAIVGVMHFINIELAAGLIFAGLSLAFFGVGLFFIRPAFALVRFGVCVTEAIGQILRLIFKRRKQRE